MENESRRRRHRSRGGATRASVAAGPTTIHDLADELLELVLLRVSSHRCLVRAAAACRPWRRLIADDGFLRRFRSVHAPIVLGHFYAGAMTAFVPAATLLVKDVAGGGVRSRVSLGFVLGKFGGINDLFLSDCRGGLLAFARSDCSVLVCDPWARQYRLLVPPTTPGRRFCLGAFLLDADEIATVRVLCVSVDYNYDQQNGTIAQISAYSATYEHWLLLARTVVEDQFVMPVLDIDLRGSGLNLSKVCVGRVGGSLFWCVRGFYVFQVNETTGAFSSFCMLPGPAETEWYSFGDERRKLRVVGRDARAVRVVRIVDEELQVLQLEDGGGMCVETRVNLSELCNIETGPDRSWHFLELSEAVPPSFVALSQDENCAWMFYVDVESMKVERVKRSNWNYRPLFPYERPWTPTIKACLKTRRRRISMSLGLCDSYECL